MLLFWLLWRAIPDGGSPPPDDDLSKARGILIGLVIMLAVIGLVAALIF